MGYTSQKGFFFYIDSTRRFARMFICIFFHVTWCLINKDKLLARLQTVILITYHYGMNTVAAPHNTLLLCVFNTWACIANKNGDLIAFRSFSHIYFLVEKDFFVAVKPFMMTDYLLTHILLSLSTGNKNKCEKIPIWETAWIY